MIILFPIGPHTIYKTFSHHLLHVLNVSTSDSTYAVIPHVEASSCADLLLKYHVFKTSIYFKRFAKNNWYNMPTFELGTMHRTCVTCRHSVVSQGHGFISRYTYTAITFN